MTKDQHKQLTELFLQYDAIKLVYFFGSRANGTEGPMSDYDFAVYFDKIAPVMMHSIAMELNGRLALLLKHDEVDVVCLNTAKKPELKYHIISGGKLIYEKDGSRVLVEPRILSEYFDFRYMLRKYNLTKA